MNARHALEVRAIALDELRRVAARHLDGVPVTTTVILGDPEVEIARDAEAFGAELVRALRAPA